MTSTADDIPISVPESISKHNNEINFQQFCCQATAFVVEVNNNSQEGAASAPTLEDLFQQQIANPFCQRASVKVGKAKVIFTVDRNRLIVRKALNQSRHSDSIGDSTQETTPIPLNCLGDSRPPRPTRNAWFEAHDERRVNQCQQAYGVRTQWQQTETEKMQFFFSKQAA